jgi:spermidine synthase
MNRNKLYYIALLVIFLEGYIVLASELIAIRLLAANLSGTTDVISVVISAVLLPLAFGYYYGGKFSQQNGQNSIRKKLVSNFVNALICLSIAFNYILITIFFAAVNTIFKNHYIISTLIYCGIFLVYPVFLLGQTIPLISNYFLKHNLSSISGKILFFSTIGSLCGSLVSTLLLMPIIGLNNTIISTIFLTIIMIFILDKRSNISNKIICVVCGIVIVFSNSADFMKTLNIVKDNEYHTIKILEKPSDDNKEKTLYFAANNAAYSILHFKNDKVVSSAAYIEYAEQFLKKDPRNPQDVLVLGAGGFAFGVNDKINNYTYVDIDKDLKEVAEKHFLNKALDENKKFEVISARLFAKNSDKKYDYILLDTFSGINVPQQLITVEFFNELKSIMKDDGIIVVNMITSLYFKNTFSKKFDNVVRSVFPHYYVTPVTQPNAKNQLFTNDNMNILYVIKDLDVYTAEKYTDDKSEYYLDK